MIEDPELRGLFEAESAEHLQRLDEGLLRLEKQPADLATLEDCFREAHSLKGAAHMLGLDGIEALAREVENLLGAARGGKLALGPGMAARLGQGLEALRRLAREAVTGESSGVNVSEALAVLRGEAVPAAGAGAPPEMPSAARRLQAAVGAYRIETVRVGTRQLDALLTAAGELRVVDKRIGRRLAQLDDVLAMSGQRERTGAAAASSGEREAAKRALREAIEAPLATVHAGLAEDGARLGLLAGEIEEGIRAVRLLPLSTLFSLFPRAVRDLAIEQAKEAELAIEGGETAADKRILEEMKDPLMHLLRNAVDHGIEPPEARAQSGKARSGRIRLRARRTAAMIVIEVSDDGRGLDPDRLRRAALDKHLASEAELAAMTEAQVQSLVFLPGFSTAATVTDVSGRGVGLDVVRTNVERLKGTLQIESRPGAGLTIRLQLPVTLATARVLIVTLRNQRYALPTEYVQGLRLLAPQEIYPLEGKDTISLDGQPVSLARLADLLELPGAAALAPEPSALPCAVIAADGERLGLLVDAFDDEQEIMLKPSSALLKRVRNVSGATILGTGEVCPVLHPPDLVRSLRRRPASRVVGPGAAPPRKKRVLLAEDSLTTRIQEKRILEGAGYEVVTAVDGLDAWNKLAAQRFDALVSDILMPNLDGLALTARIRGQPQHKDLPVILVTTLASEDDRRRGLEAGANAYIAKPGFDQTALLDALRRLA